MGENTLAMQDYCSCMHMCAYPPYCFLEGSNSVLGMGYITAETKLAMFCALCVHTNILHIAFVCVCVCMCVCMCVCVSVCMRACVCVCA